MKKSATTIMSLAITGAGVLAGCGGVVDDTGQTEGLLVTSSVSLSAAETSVTSVSSGKLVMTYNEDDPNKVSFANNSRQINLGASLMGFAQLRVSDGSKITGRMAPPSGWAVLWGDPAITRSRANANNVYLTNLAIPNEKFTTSIVGSVATSTPANFCDAYVGGACVARSSNGGQSFTLTGNDCVRRTSTDCPFGTFYDGADIETSPEGRIYVAYWDVHRKRIDVWMAGGHNSPFSRITDPPASPSATGHPRIKYGSDGFYLVYPAGTSLVITRYNGGASFTGSWTPNSTVTTGFPGVQEIPFPNLPGPTNKRDMRTGPEFDFDIGPGETGSGGPGSPNIRVVFTSTSSSGKRFITVKSCLSDPLAGLICQDRGSGWTTSTLTGDQYSPTIAARQDTTNWWISFLNTNASVNNTVEVWSGKITTGFMGVGSMRLRREVAAQTPCPDLVAQYWGDYDSMAIDVSGNAYRGFTDSTITSCQRFNYTATPMRASLATWNTAAF